MTYTLFLVLIMIVAFLLILIIMVQNPKGGGLSSSFGGGSQSLGGVQNTTNFLDKSTWTLSIVLLALILLSNFAAPKMNAVDTSSEIENTLQNREVQSVPVETAPATTQDTVQ
jgi:preprotein translocase subunit SecG